MKGRKVIVGQGPLGSSEAAVRLKKAPSSEEGPGWLCFPGAGGAQRPNLSQPPFLRQGTPQGWETFGPLASEPTLAQSEEILLSESSLPCLFSG